MATLDMLAQAATQLANADVPESVLRALALSRLTALSKPAGGVRGIATGDTLRRLVSRTLARQFAPVFDRATRPYQFALQARAGTDCLAAMLRAATELDADATVVSLDGRCAYDTVSRTAFLSKLREVAPSLVPYVRAWYGAVSTYLWWDADGQRHDVPQGEGCEQGDALAPALFALAQHDALHEAQGRLQAGEFLAAFLDDLYLVTTSLRARAALDDTTAIVEARAGVAANLGKTRVYRVAEGPPPPGIAELGPDVWCGAADAADRGFVALGVPIGSADFVRRRLEERLQAEQSLLQELRQLPDLQCAWLLLLYCASPRARGHSMQYALCRRPSPASTRPRMIAPYGGRCAQHLLSEPDAEGEVWEAARSLAFLPTLLGGLGLCSAERVRAAAYWAAWADALPVMHQRRPDAAARCARELAAADAAAAPSLRAAAAAGAVLDAEGWTTRPDWPTLLEGVAPPAPAPDEPAETGDWIRGWQRPAARALNTSYRERLLLSLRADSRALLRSQSGAHAGEWLRAIPADAASTLAPPEMLIALRRRLRLPLPLAAARCGGGGEAGCGARVDELGDHRAACARSGLLARRAPLLERAWVRSLARRLALKAALCLNSGFCTPPRLGSRPTIGAASTSFCTAPPGAARRCAAMSRSCHPCARTGCHSREVAIVTARQSKSRGAGNSHGTLSLLGPDRKGSWCWRALGQRGPRSPASPRSRAVPASSPRAARSCYSRLAAPLVGVPELRAAARASVHAAGRHLARTSAAGRRWAADAQRSRRACRTGAALSAAAARRVGACRSGKGRLDASWLTEKGARKKKKTCKLQTLTLNKFVMSQFPGCSSWSDVAHLPRWPSTRHNFMQFDTASHIN